MLINSLYGMKTTEQTMEQRKRLANAIALLGDKYLLATPINKVNKNG
jgi:hypothetical protein